MQFSHYFSALEDFVKQWRDFKGLTSRRYYWFVLSTLITLFCIEHIFFFIAYLRQDIEQWVWLNNIYYYMIIGEIFVLIFPLSSITIRRLRDVGRAPLSILYVLIPLGMLILLSFITGFSFTYGYAELCVIFFWLIGILCLIFGSVLLLGWCGEKGLDRDLEEENAARAQNERGEIFEEFLESAYFSSENEDLFDNIDMILGSLEACCADGFRRYNKELPNEETHLWGELLAKAEMISVLLAEARTSHESLLYLQFLSDVKRGLGSLLRKARLSDDEELYDEVLHLVENAKREVERLHLNLVSKK